MLEVSTNQSQQGTSQNGLTFSQLSLRTSKKELRLTLDNKAINLVIHLELIFDDTLSRKQYIQYLKQTCLNKRNDFNEQAFTEILWS